MSPHQQQKPPGKLLEIQSLPHPTSTESEILGLEFSNLFKQTLQIILMHI